MDYRRHLDFLRIECLSRVRLGYPVVRRREELPRASLPPPAPPSFMCPGITNDFTRLLFWKCARLWPICPSCLWKQRRRRVDCAWNRYRMHYLRCRTPLDIAQMGPEIGERVGAIQGRHPCFYRFFRVRRHLWPASCAAAWEF